MLKYILWGEFIISLADKNETFDKLKKSSSENGVEFSVRFLIHFLIISLSHFFYCFYLRKFSFEIFVGCFGCWTYLNSSSEKWSICSSTCTSCFRKRRTNSSQWQFKEQAVKKMKLIKRKMCPSLYLSDDLHVQIMLKKRDGRRWSKRGKWRC